ncbi:hypothetical protein K2Z83_15615 [Oscillochloris sp. ZM17-4]|uniref:hypothetical protein n=1 Tax=Oscillochloris sp. ZM17-4 TaxID=2866714 RepID=UPI001C736798|nr:hypothetical protein [Oscillochloris sp. ZM17-4]MBX0329105.1 hypothetical protein [Oscillochloris sp. ZM17-4]
MATASTTVLFDRNGILASMIIEPKNPRFEIVRGSESVKTVPATSAWRSEQKAIVAEATELAAAAVTNPILTTLRERGWLLGIDGHKPTRAKLVLSTEENPDGSFTLTFAGGKNAAARDAARVALRDSMIEAHLNVTIGGGELTVSAMSADDDCAEDDS